MKHAETRRTLHTHTHTHTHTTKSLLSFFSSIKIMLTAFVMCVTFFLSAQGVTITYDLNGGELSNGANSYQADSNNNNNAVLDNPTKTGYIFTGWCDTNDYTAATNTCSNRVGLVTTNNNNATKTMVRWTVPNDLSTDTTFIAMWEEDKFQMGITGIVANDNDNKYFAFRLGAEGNFWIDWGDGNIEYINKNNTSDITYSHTYVANGGYTVRFGGIKSGINAGAIRFGKDFYNDWTDTSVNENLSVSSANSRLKVNTISGSVGEIFPTVTNGGYQYQPQFINLFHDCTNLTGSIPATLFSGISGTPIQSMFYGTFSGCSGLTGQIPATLFSGISGAPAQGMFWSTFEGCSGLTGSIPASLFDHIILDNSASINNTFDNCTNLGKNAINGTSTYYIPPTLIERSFGWWASVGGYNTFRNTGLLTSCPDGLVTYYTTANVNDANTDVLRNNQPVSCIAPNSIVCEIGTSLALDSNGNYVCTNCSGVSCPTIRTVQTCPSGYTNNADFSACIQPYTISYENVTGATVSGPVQYYYESDTGRYYHRFSTNETWKDGYYTSVCVGTGSATKPNYQITGWCEGQNNCPNLQRFICIENGDTGNKTFYAQWEFVCPETDMPEESGIYALDPAWFDLDGNNSGANANECISMMYAMDDATAAETCMYKALCNVAPATAANMKIPCAQLASETCDYATAGLSYATCRYNAQTYESAGFYTDCSTVVNVCNDADMVALLPAMSGQTDSAGLFPVELTKKGYNQTGSDVSNWNTYFGQSVLTLIPLVQNGMTFGDAWDTLNTYNTCSGGSSAFTCESNTWLHVGNEQICTYATKTTDRALAIRVDANHVYYVMLTPASENDYPIHAGSNYKLKIREYNAAGTESTIYNAHDMSVVSE